MVPRARPLARTLALLGTALVAVHAAGARPVREAPVAQLPATLGRNAQARLAAGASRTYWRTLEAGAERIRIAGRHGSRLACAAYAEDGRLLAADSAGARPCLLDLRATAGARVRVVVRNLGSAPLEALLTATGRESPRETTAVQPGLPRPAPPVFRPGAEAPAGSGRPQPRPGPSPSPRTAPRGPVAIDTPGAGASAASVDEVVRGMLAHDIPPRMHQGRPATVAVRLARGTTDTASLLVGMEGRSPVVTLVPVGRVMRVVLVDVDHAFRIDTLAGSGRRSVLDERERLALGAPAAEWRWRVTPLVSGTKDLAVSALVMRTGGDEAPLEVPVAQVTVPVEIDLAFVAASAGRGLLRHMAQHPEWYAGGSLAALLGALFRRRRGGGPEGPRALRPFGRRRAG